MNLDGETAVSPELSLAAETIWGLQQGHQQGSTNRSDRRNLAKQLDARMPAALQPQVGSRWLAHRLQQIQLLIQPLGAEPNSGFCNLGQPFCARMRSLDGRTLTGNGPAAVQSLDPIHDSGEILGEGPIAATQLFQGAHPIFFVIHRLELLPS
jgi:hypothetical protein